MSPINWTEIVLIASAIGGAVAWLVKLHADKRKETAELGKIDIESWKMLREQVGEMEEKIVKLRDRVDVLEEQLDVKEATIKKLETRLNKLVIYVSGLLRELNEKGIQYTPPEKGLLDTDPRIPAVKGGK